jgi:hypothetical protein
MSRNAADDPNDPIVNEVESLSESVQQRAAGARPVPPEQRDIIISTFMQAYFEATAENDVTLDSKTFSTR